MSMERNNNCNNIIVLNKNRLDWPITGGFEPGLDEIDREGIDGMCDIDEDLIVFSVDDLEDGGDVTVHKEFQEELDSFRNDFPEVSSSFGKDIVALAFRKLYDMITSHEPVICTGTVAREITAELEAGGIVLLGSRDVDLSGLLDAIMRHLAGVYQYCRTEVDSVREDLERMIWPFTAKSPGAAEAAASIAEALLDYYREHEEISSLDASAYVRERYPDAVSRDVMDDLAGRFFDLLEEQGFMSYTDV
jgi:hypothetical protein